MLMKRTVPFILLLGSVSLLAYGAARHRTTVHVDKDVTELVPPPPEPPEFDPQSGRLIFRPPPKPVPVTRTLHETSIEPEYRIVLEATRGGVRLAEGRIERTYSGSPPS